MEYNLCDTEVIERLLRKNGFKFSKALGQNFITDENVCPEMADSLCLDDDGGVLEIGPGIGVLTKELCKKAKKVVSIELDKRLYPVLGETLADYDNFELVKGDIMKLDLKKLVEEKFSDCSEVSVCANLPYYITSPVIMLLLEEKLPFKEVVVMVQKEAAERLCAEMGTRKAGAITAAVNYYGEAQKLFEVKRSSFYPSPKVDSEVIKIRLYEEAKYKVESEKDFFKIVRAAFAQRRKTLVNSLSSTLGVPKQKISIALYELGLDEDIRAEKLTMDDFVKIYEVLKA